MCKKKGKMLYVLVAALVATVGCKTTRPVEDPARQLREEIAPALGLELAGELTQGGEKNFVGVRSEDVLLSRRTDSRTYFAQDERWGLLRDHGIFAGSDDELMARCREIAETLGVDGEEIAEATVLQVMNNVAYRERVSGEMRAEEPQRGERYALLSRAVHGIPIFSSKATLALDREGRIGFLELHWPELSHDVVAAAGRLQQMVAEGWKPYDLPRARIESMEAGILHSPAVGFVMDVRPVIRVIYQPFDQQAGKKPMLYLDAEGQPVPVPRQFERLEVPKEGARERGGS